MSYHEFKGAVEWLDRLNKTTRDLWEAQKKCIEKMIVAYGP